jgi:hypothetical protein
MIRRCTLAPTLDTSRRSMNSSKDVPSRGIRVIGAVIGPRQRRSTHQIPPLLTGP